MGKIRIEMKSRQSMNDRHKGEKNMVNDRRHEWGFNGCHDASHPHIRNMTKADEYRTVCTRMNNTIDVPWTSTR